MSVFAILSSYICISIAKMANNSNNNNDNNDNYGNNDNYANNANNNNEVLRGLFLVFQKKYIKGKIMKVISENGENEMISYFNLKQLLILRMNSESNEIKQMLGPCFLLKVNKKKSF